MGIGVEGEGRQCELGKRMSDESPFDGEEQPETQIGADTPPALKKYDTLTEMYKTFVGPPSGGKPPARKRPRGDLEVDTPTAKANNANEESSEWKKYKEVGKNANQCEDCHQ